MTSPDIHDEEMRDLLEAHQALIRRQQEEMKSLLADLRKAEELIAVGKTHAGHLAILKILTENKL